MKLKISILVCMAAAGVLASVALAHGGHGKGDGHGLRGGSSCQKLHVNGTLAAGSLVITPRAHRSDDHEGTTTTGATTTTAAPVTVAVPANSRIEATACGTVSGTSTTWQLRQAEIEAPKQQPTSNTPTVTVTVTVTTPKP
jgi:hypothetical protein